MINTNKIIYAIITTNKITHSIHVSAFYGSKELAERELKDLILADNKGGPNPYESKICSKYLYEE